MQADVWKRVEELFRAAQAQPPEKRAEFLEKACPDDAQVRREVQSLLNAAPGAASFLDSSPLSSALSPGARLGHFEILGPLGRGGMGEVYRARDSRLERDVAIKVLPLSFARDPDRIARFEREARAAGALNHPNIVSVYDIGRDNSTYWIVSELVDGETLRRIIDRGPLAARKALEIAVQIAEGLAAAHAAGIVHRDLKPGNIMVMHAGHVKILDFGLAKREHLATDSSIRELTNEGTVLGTAGYMSPEQVRGEDVDYRSDIFSFGVNLYEMLAGKQAFSGSSSIELMNAILKSDPPDLPPSVPPSLDRIVRRCLEKDPARRFMSAADLGFALASLSASQPAFAVTLNNLARRTWKIVTAAFVAAGLVALTWFLLYRPPKPSAELTQKRLTFNSSENRIGWQAISPDGKYLAYSDSAGIHVKLFVREEERIIPRPAGIPATTDWSVASWFPDGTQLLANKWEPDGGRKSTWTVSVLGQSPRKLREDAVGLEVSPDGTHIAFSPLGGSDNMREIWVMGSQGDNPQRVLAVGEHEELRTMGVHWSPDGHRLAYIRALFSPERLHTSIETCDLKGMNRTAVVPDMDLILTDFRWLSEGRIVYARGEWAPNGDGNLWEIGIDNRAGTPTGKPKRITSWAGSLLGNISASADGKRLVLRKLTYQEQIFLGELTAGGTRLNRPHRLTNNEASERPTAWMPDSKAVLITSNRGGTWGIYKQGISQETSEKITGINSNFYPDETSPARAVIAPDSILFMEIPKRSAHPAPLQRMMRIPLSGGAPQLVLETRNWVDFRCAQAPASLCVIFEPSQDGKQFMVTEFDPVKGRGRVLRAIENNPSHPYNKAVLSSDGSMFAISRMGEPQIHLRLLSLSSGSDREITVKGWPEITGLDWSPDGKGLYCGSGGDTLLYVDLKGSARVLWQYKSGDKFIWGVPSPDGRYLAIGVEVTNTNLWMVEGF